MDKKYRKKRKKGFIASLIPPEKTYEIHQTSEGLNIMTETQASKNHTEEWRFKINFIVSLIAVVASIIAAIFSALTYINNKRPTFPTDASENAGIVSSAVLPNDVESP